MKKNHPTEHYLFPNWPAPENIHSVQSTRLAGNLATHVNDDPEHVKKNRTKLEKDLDIPSPPFWLEQVHGNQATSLSENFMKQADASFTRECGKVCAILTADCLPILICSKAGDEIAAIHAGWRGLLSGVITETLKQLHSQPSSLMAWLGPSLCQENCELNAQIRLDFIHKSPENERAFQFRDPDHWFADLYELARIQLRQFGLEDIYGGDFCTYRDEALFFSHRREKGQTGRMASLIWISEVKNNVSIRS